MDLRKIHFILNYQSLVIEKKILSKFNYQNNLLITFLLNDLDRSRIFENYSLISQNLVRDSNPEQDCKGIFNLVELKG